MHQHLHWRALANANCHMEVHCNQECRINNVASERNNGIAGGLVFRDVQSFEVQVSVLMLLFFRIRIWFAWHQMLLLPTCIVRQKYRSQQTIAHI